MKSSTPRRGVDLALISVWLCAALCCLCCVYIFGNSLQVGESSLTRSEQLAEQVKPIIDSADEIDSTDFHILVRKSAHVIEFAALGLCLGGLMVSIYCKYRRRVPFAMLFAALTVSVSDEFIQSFTKRTSLVSDILIDFGGAAAGLAAVSAAAGLVWLIRRRRLQK